MRPGIYVVEYVAESKVTDKNGDGYELKDHVIADNAQYAINKVFKHVLSETHTDDNGKEYPVTKFTLLSVALDRGAEY